MAQLASASQRSRLLRGVGLSVLLACGGCIDVLTGVPCRTDVDCFGDQCIEGVCQKPIHCAADNDCASGDFCDSVTGFCRMDAGVAIDAGPAEDAGLQSDAGSPNDSGFAFDAGAANDAGFDAGETRDAGHSTDAGHSADAGQTPDAGETPDAGPPDSGFNLQIVTTVVQSADGAPFLEPGVAACLTLQITNMGAVIAKNIHGELSVSTAGVSVAHGALVAQDLPSGSSESITAATPTALCPSGQIEIDVSLTTSLASPAQFALTLSDEPDGTATFGFDEPIEGNSGPFALRTVSVATSGFSSENPNLSSSLLSGANSCMSLSFNYSGSAPAANVTGTLTSSTSGVTIVNGAGLGTSGTIAAHGSGSLVPASNTSLCSGSTIEVDIDSSVAPGTTVLFTLTLGDAASDMSVVPFTLTAQNGVVVTVSLVQVSTPGAEANLSPGYQSCLTVTLGNAGIVDASSLTGTLTTSAPGVTIVNGTGLSPGALAAQSTSVLSSSTSTATCGTGIEVDVAPQATVTSVDFSLNLSDASGNQYPLSFSQWVSPADVSFLISNAGLTGNQMTDAGIVRCMSLTLQDTGRDPAEMVVGTLTSTTSGVTVQNGAGLSFGNLIEDEWTPATTSMNSPYCDANDVALLLAAPPLTTGEELDFVLTVTDVQGNTYVTTTEFFY